MAAHSERIRAAREHSASRRVDVLAVEAPELVAPATRELSVVLDVESDELTLTLLGTYQDSEEDVIFYSDTDGVYRRAPADCVRVVKVSV